MMVESQSPSEVLRASAILLIRLDEVVFGSWTPESESGVMSREVTMRLVILEVLKGRVRQRVGEPFALRVRQRGSGSRRVMDFYGVWSHARLDEGATLLAFCRGPSDDATQLLSEENCDELLDPATALEDTRAALEAEHENLSVADLSKRAESRAGPAGDVFARYVLAKLEISPLDALARAGPEGKADLERQFDALVRLLEDPKTTEPARASYATAVYELVTLTEPPPVDLQRRLARVMFRLLGLPAGQSLRVAILDVYLPHLVGLAGASPRQTATDLFQELPAERAAAERALAGYPGNPSAVALLRWIRSA